MGQASVDLQREIELIRDDLSATIAELERRARRSLDVRAQVRQHWVAVGTVAFGLLAASGMAGYNAYQDYRARRRRNSPFRRRARERWREIGAALPIMVVQQQREDRPMSARRRKDPGIVKKLMWMGLAAGMVALFGLVARRASAAIWEAVMHEPPPTARV